MSFIGDLMGNNQPQSQGTAVTPAPYVPTNSEPASAPSTILTSGIKDEGDLSDKYNTKLSAEDESKFKDWAKDHPKLASTYDYDARGFFKAGAGAAENGHGSDEFKKPNHPTFSDQSKYHGSDGNEGGKWGKDGDADTFMPSPTNLKNMSPEQLKRYFAKVEPGAKLLLPNQ